MELSKAISSRRSTRNFLEDATISNTQLADIFKSGSMAPSAKNRQNWKFILVDGKSKDALVEVINSCIDEEFQYEQIKESDQKSILNSIRCIDECSVFAICIIPNFDVSMLYGDLLSLGACIENMLLTATELGIDTLWVRDICYCLPVIESFIVNRCRLDYNPTKSDIVCGICFGIRCTLANDKSNKLIKGLDQIIYNNNDILPVINISDL